MATEIKKIKTGRKVFCDSFQEMCEQLDMSEELEKSGKMKFMSVEESYRKNKEFIKNLSL